MNVQNGKNCMIAFFLCLLCIVPFGAQAAVIFEDDFEVYPVSDPSDFSATSNWSVSGPGGANADRIFQTSNYGGTRLWISLVDATNLESAGITVAAGTTYQFSALIACETSNAGRSLNASYDLLVGTNLLAATSVIGGPQAIIARGDGDGSKADQIVSNIFTTGAVGAGEFLFIRITRVSDDVGNPFFCVDDVTISDFSDPPLPATIITPGDGQTAVSPEAGLLHWYVDGNSAHTSQTILLDTVTPPVNQVAELGANLRDYDLGSLTPSTLYYARIDTFHPGQTVQSAIISFTTGMDSLASNPPPTSGQILHLDATVGVLNSGGTPATDGQQVQTWQDQSPAGNNVVNAGAGEQPVFEDLSDSGQPSLIFDGSDRLIAAATTDFDFGTGPMEYFWVAKSTDPSPAPDNEKIIFGKASDGSLTGFMVGERIGGVGWRHYGSPTAFFSAPAAIDPTTWSSGNWNSSGSPQSNNAYVDGIQYVNNFVPGTDYDYDTTVLFAVGDQNGSDGLDTDEFVGEIAEVIFYNRLLSDSERTDVRLYLASKYDQPFKYDFVSPTIDITTPNGGTILSIDTLTLDATAADQNAGGTVAQVEFFANGVSIGSDSIGEGTNSDEYSLDWTPGVPGFYTITAVATDNDSPSAFYVVDDITVNVVNPRYVTVAGGGDGTSWSTPLNIASAVAQLNAGNGGVIYMQTGLYVTTETITLSDTIEIYGGFAGTEVSADDRSGTYESDFPTTISGNNSHRVINGDGSPGMVLDGLIITEGFTTGGAGGAIRGAGVRYANTTAFATINRCTFFNNNTSAYGAGAYLGDVILTNSRFTSNTSVVTGGAVSSAGAFPVHFVENCIFDKNLCRGVFGGAYFAGSGNYYVSHCTFVDNIGNNGVADPANGDAVVKRNGGGSSWLNCVFVGQNVAFNHNDEGAHTGPNRVFMTNCFFDTASPNSVVSEDVAVPVVETNPISGVIDFIPGTFRPSASSPAVNAGALDDVTLDGLAPNAGVPAIDIIGVPRADQLPDIGAFEIPFNEVVIAPIPIDFGTVATVSSTTQTFTVLNGTANQVTITSVTLTGSEAGFFVLDLGTTVFPVVLDSAESFDGDLVFNSTTQLPGFLRDVQVNVFSNIAPATGQVLAINGNITRAQTWNLME